MASGVRKGYDLYYLENQLSLARNEIHNLRQQLKTLQHVHRKECDEILKRMNKFKCSNCQGLNCDSNEIGATAIGLSSTSGSSELVKNSVDLKYIGVIHTQFPSKRGTPRQPTICSDAVGKLVMNNDIFTNPHHALQGLEQFSHMWIIFHFHQTDSTHIPAKVAPPRLNGLRMGVFGTRSPHRPSPLGLSLVKINQISENVIYFSGVDMVDQTPVVDIKPYIPQYDTPNQINLYYPEAGLCDNSDEDPLRPPSGDGQSTRNESLEMEDESMVENSNMRTLEGQENERSNIVPGAITNEHSRYFTFEAIRPNSRIGEREAPDGEEEGTNNDNSSISMNPNELPQRQVDSLIDPVRIPVRVPRWVENPVVPTLTVQFKMPAEIQLRQLGLEGEEKKKIIKNVLSEDPRSVYLRERQGDCPYVFRIADLYVSCEFNDEDRTVFVFKVDKGESSEPSEDNL
ncbi:hypothetical protein WA026_022818 [Henosepilachna vigintioctopunctata]|uniref:TsaA-like domain-containing protein n=1 Tax=Henosepilachna vigintioctopunctata TaxID=420089 RepID=A0AAW1VBA3_9CUCU